MTTVVDVPIVYFHVRCQCLTAIHLLPFAEHPPPTNVAFVVVVIIALQSHASQLSTLLGAIVVVDARLVFSRTTPLGGGGVYSASYNVEQQSRRQKQQQRRTDDWEAQLNLVCLSCEPLCRGKNIYYFVPFWQPVIGDDKNVHRRRGDTVWKRDAELRSSVKVFHDFPTRPSIQNGYICRFCHGKVINPNIFLLDQPLKVK